MMSDEIVHLTEHLLQYNRLFMKYYQEGEKQIKSTILMKSLNHSQMR